MGPENPAIAESGGYEDAGREAMAAGYRRDPGARGCPILRKRKEQNIARLPASRHRGDGRQLIDGLDIVADSRELGVDPAGKTVQAGDGDERDQGRDQSVFDQILAGLIVQKVLQKLFHYPVLLNDSQRVRS
jgi:hypothetical protein